MPVHQLADLTWNDASTLSADAVCLLPIGALEAHGPHLPLQTDVIIAEAMARNAADRIAGGGRTVLILPTLAYTAAPFAESFAGTLSIHPDHVVGQIVDIARALTAVGCSRLMLINAHFDPTHLSALSEAEDICRQEGLLQVIFPNVTRKPWASRLGAEFASGACHAGRYEGSIVLAARPDLVHEETMRSLEPNHLSLSDAVREGKQTFMEVGGTQAYFGFPAEATAAEGEMLIETLGRIVEESLDMARPSP